MCGPGGASLIGQGIGATAGAVGAAMSASATRMGYRMDAFVARMNEKVASDNARFALQKGEQQEQNVRYSAAQLKSSQRAAMGANNVDMSTGSAQARLASTDYLEEVDAKTVRLNATREAIGYRNDALGNRMKATMADGAAKGINPMLTGASSLLSSGTKIASNWYQMREAGMFGGAKFNQAAFEANNNAAWAKLGTINPIGVSYGTISLGTGG